jgi:hypothetical protein
MATNLAALKQVGIESFAETLGFTRDKVASSKRVAVLRNDAGDKLLVTAGRKGCDIYRNERDHADHGDIVDFVMRRLRLGFNEARDEMARWSGVSADKNHSFHPEDSEADPSGHRKKSLAVWNDSRWNSAHPYLLSRGLDRGTLADPRFADTFRQDWHGNAVFPHHDRGGLCGYERRGPVCKRFGKDVKKGLWFSANLKTASVIVVTESVIDALSHSRLYASAYCADVAYCALGGSIGSRQRDLLAGLFVKAGDRNALVVIGTDNDGAGDQFFDDLSLLAPMSLDRLRPIGKDWNDDLVFCNREQGGTSWI